MLVIFFDRRLSILEALVRNLKGKGMKNSEIAKVLNKDPRNVHTSYKRAERKVEEKEELNSTNDYRDLG